MNVAKEVADILAKAFEYANVHHLEYVTPELFLYIMCECPTFKASFLDCNGDIKKLQADLLEYIDEYVECLENVEPALSDGVALMFMKAQQTTISSGNTVVKLSHVIRSLYQLEECYAVYFLRQQEIDEVELLEYIIEDEDGGDYSYHGDESEEELDDEGGLYSIEGGADKTSKSIDGIAPCLNDTLKDVNPLIGRTEEIERTIQILCRKDKNNPLHIGEPGVGKTAITYGLVELIRENKVPDALIGAKVFALDLGSLVAGTQYRGTFEKKLKKVLAEIDKFEKPIIYIDEIHNLSGAGASHESSLDASNILKPYLASGHIRFIGATTFEEYKRYFEKDKSLIRRFQNVEIKEPSAEECIEILEGLRKSYEKYHGVKYTKGVFEYAVKMSDKYINERYLPDKAIDLIDEAGSYRKLHPLNQKQQSVSKDLINKVLTNICRVDIETVDSENIENLASLESRINAEVFGQDLAIKSAVNAIKFSKAGMLEDNKPLASMLFVGPTGVGKTEIAKSLAKQMGYKLIRFDMSEYGEKHAIAKLIGAPAGYVGYEEGGLLTEEIRKNPSAVLLLDEIEKAHPDIFHVLLQVMDYATLTDNQGRKADFRNVIIIMTSNAGAAMIGKPGLGFGKDEVTEDVVTDEVKRIFTPEFRNRLNKIVVFNSMNEDMAMLIAKKKLNALTLLLTDKKVAFTYTEKAVQKLCKEGISREYGAREIDRVIESEIKPLLVDEILFGKLRKGGKCQLDVDKNNFYDIRMMK